MAVGPDTISGLKLSLNGVFYEKSRAIEDKAASASAVNAANALNAVSPFEETCNLMAAVMTHRPFEVTDVDRGLVNFVGALKAGSRYPFPIDKTCGGCPAETREACIELMPSEGNLCLNKFLPVVISNLLGKDAWSYGKHSGGLHHRDTIGWSAHLGAVLTKLRDHARRIPMTLD